MGEQGTIYLIHFAEPFGHAQHYIGWTSDLDARIERHRSGRGSALLRHVTAAGIDWEVVWTKPGDRAEERRIKGMSSASARHCPICRPAWLEHRRAQRARRSRERAAEATA